MFDFNTVKIYITNYYTKYQSTLHCGTPIIAHFHERNLTTYFVYITAYIYNYKCTVHKQH